MKAKKGITLARLLVLGYGVVILMSTLLLFLPIASNSKTTLLDAFFTAVSATCVTGLVVLDTGTHWTLFGQIVIIITIQIGGLGIATLIGVALLLFDQKINLSHRLFLQQDVNNFDLKGIVRLMQNVLMLTFGIEGLGAVLLATQFIPKYGFAEGLWKSIFHAISAFCNAGFDIFGGNVSLSGFQDNPIVLYTIGMLIILGGLGFIVILELARFHRQRKLSFHSKLVLITTTILLLGAVIFIGISEYNATALAHLAPLDRWNNIVFLAITPRTAGFANVDLASLQLATGVLTIILMFIGASSGSTGGGVKNTTIAILVLSVIADLKKQSEVVVFRKKVLRTQIQQATNIITLAILAIAVAIIILSFTDAEFGLLAIAFETVSAFGTVGSSLNMTPGLSSIGKHVIIILMFIGRVGPITLGLSIFEKRQVDMKHPEGRVLVG